ncbi:hypothetical protein RIF29_10762 [Crotalaria pallida]|uniref:Uncharacterized protein n=1 Tax=Crotalaria pallida TaxID=3830 RepID=A0AAN9FW30_CROPI
MMGTLTSYSLMPVSSELFRSNSVRHAFREKIQFHQLNGACSSTSSSTSCFFLEKRDLNFCRFRCFSSSNNNSGNDDVDGVGGGEGESGGNASKDSSNTIITSTLPEPEQRRESGFNSDKSTTPSPSPRGEERVKGIKRGRWGLVGVWRMGDTQCAAWCDMASLAFM